MKKLANTFFKVAKILDIVAIVLYAIAAVILAVVAAMDAAALVALQAGGAEAYEIQEAALLLGTTIGSIVEVIILLAFCIVALVLVGKCKNTLNTAQSKAEAKKMAIVAIITGALSTAFAAVAGILMLCMKDEDYSGNVVEVETVE